MTAPLILSVFPGIDLLGRAFEEVWPECCVVRGPDLLWGGDIRHFHPPAGRFDGVIGGPPCQAFSRLRHLVEHNGYKVAENLIPEFERVVREAEPEWFLMENVPEAPLPFVREGHPVVCGYYVSNEVVRDVWCGGETSRARRFTFGTRRACRFEIPTLALHRPDPEPAVCASGGYRAVPVAVGGSGKRKSTKARDLGFKTAAAVAAALRLQGLPPDFLDHAPFTVVGKHKVIGNGVPLAMGRAVARAVREAIGRAIAATQEAC